MDTRLLANFLVLAEELHFNRAAARCHISQSALSQQLMRLEADLNVQLVNRTKSSVSLTRTGEMFVVEAQNILRTVHEAERLARQSESGMVGRIIVAATAPAMFIILPEIVAAFAKLLPQVEIVVRNMATAEQEEALRRGDIDIGLVHPPLDDRNLVCTEIATLPFDLAMSQHNPLSKLAAVRMDDLEDQTFVLFPRQIGPRFYDSIIGLCLQQGFSPKNIIEMAPAQSQVAAVACNLGVAFVASRLQHFVRPPVVYRQVVGPAPTFAIAIAHRADKMTLHLDRFIELASSLSRNVK